MELINIPITPLAPNSELLRIQHMEQVMRDLPNELQVEPQVTHYFGTGTYCRQMDIEPGVLVAGRMHKGSTITVILEGEVAVYSNHGLLNTAKAGEVLITPPKTKRLWYSNGKSKILTVHNDVNISNHSTLEELEKDLLVPIEQEGNS